MKSMDFVEWFLYTHKGMTVVYLSESPMECARINEWAKSKPFLSKLIAVNPKNESAICGRRADAIIVDDLANFEIDIVDNIIRPALFVKSTSWRHNTDTKQLLDTYSCAPFIYDVASSSFVGIDFEAYNKNNL